MNTGGTAPSVRFLSRAGCHLCDEALDELNRFLVAGISEGRFHPRTGIEVVDIETDDGLHRAYLERIPVVLVGDRIVSELEFDSEALESALKD